MINDISLRISQFNVPSSIILARQWSLTSVQTPFDIPILDPEMGERTVQLPDGGVDRRPTQPVDYDRPPRLVLVHQT